MKKAFRIGLVFGILAMLIALICVNDISADNINTNRCYQRSELYAGKNIDVGYVRVETVCTTYLEITYIIEEPGWEITETHLAVVDDPDDFPQTKKGNPKVGHFPYKGQLQYEIDLCELGVEPCDIVYIAAHAVVENGCQEETAWANTGTSFSGASWALYFAYRV